MAYRRWIGVIPPIVIGSAPEAPVGWKPFGGCLGSDKSPKDLQVVDVLATADEELGGLKWLEKVAADGFFYVFFPFFFMVFVDAFVLRKRIVAVVNPCENPGPQFASEAFEWGSDDPGGPRC